MTDTVKKENRMDKYYELYEFLWDASEKLRTQLGKIAIDQAVEEIPDRLERLAGELSRMTDHVVHEIEDLKPTQPSAEEFRITDELCEEAFREGLAAKNFSVGFLQRRFRLKYTDACKLQDELRGKGKIKRVFLVDDIVCKG